MSTTRASFWTRLLFTEVQLVRRIGVPFGVLSGVVVAGAAGYYALGVLHAKQWSLIECVFMSVITLTTIGYSDDLGVHAYPEGRLYTIGFVMVGVAIAGYAFASITAFVVEGHLRKFFKERRMEKLIDNLSGHTIICGVGTTGHHVVAEHVATKSPFVIVDASRAAIDHMVELHGEVPFIVGDATDEIVLGHAGIDRARALVSCLTTDKDNLFLVVSARYRRKDVPILVKIVEPGMEGRFRAAGASEVVMPTYIGGMRLASLVVRPQVVGFLDTMLRGKSAARVSEATVGKGSALDGKKLADARIQDELGLSVVALKRAGESEFVYGPRGDVVLNAGTTVVVIGLVDHLSELQRMMRAA